MKLYALLLLPLALDGCGGDSGEERAAARQKPSPAGAVPVQIEEFEIRPPTVTVRAGATVTFANGGRAP